MATDFQLLPVQGVMSYTFDWSEELTGGATLASVAWSITPQTGSPLAPSVADQSDNLSEAQSTITVANGVHGKVYVLQAIGTTSTGEEIPKDVGLVCVNG